MAEKTRYKVLVDGKSCHGGDLIWSLPTQREDGSYTPGAWHEVAPPLVLCERGLHATTDPMAWPKVDMAVYEVEVSGLCVEPAGDKSAHERMRCVRPAPDMVPDWWHASERFILDEIPATPWFAPDGDPDPTWKLFFGATWDSARNSAWDSARNSAWDSAWNSARNSAWNSAWNSDRDSARAWNGAWNGAWNSARDSARDSAWNSDRDSARASDRASDGARDAALYTCVEHICSGLDIPKEYRAHARARWNVWQKGYALLCDVDGVLYVYGVEK